MKSSLNITVVLSVLLTVAVTLSVGSYFIIQEEQERILHNMKAETSTLSNIIADNLSVSFQRVKEDRDLLQSLAEQIHKHERLVFVEIFNRDGIIIAHTNKDKVGSMPSPTHGEYVKSVFETGTEIEKEEHDRKRLVKFVPVYVSVDEQQEIVGVMELAVSMEAGMKEAIGRSNILVELYKSIAGNTLTAFTNSQDYIQLVTERIVKDEKVLHVEIFDRNATIIAHTEKSRVGQRPLPIHEQHVKKVLQTGVAVEEEDFEKNRFNRFVPYFAGSNKGSKEIAGVVELVMDMKPVMAQLEALKNKMVMIVLSLMIVIVSALLFMLRKLVLQPVRELTLATRDMAEGNMRRQVSIASKNELGELGDAFNSMVVNLKKSQTDLLEAKGKAEEASRAKSEFLSSMSHEIRTPMTSIISVVELLSDSPLNEDQQNSVRILKGASENLLALISDILDLSKIEAGHLELEEVEFGLEELLFETVSFMGVSARGKGLELSYHVEPEIPIKFIGDPKRLRQIIFNLLSNALKFTKEGRIDINVSKRETKDDITELEFYIKDTGIGIPEDKLDVIFKKFTQADSSTTRKFGGTGLGTTISKSLVEAMGGSIWAESELGKGSTFYFTLKLETAKTAKKEKGTKRKEPIPWERPLRILVVEDSEDNLNLILMHLKKTPHVVDTAENGKVAVEKFQAGSYDLVLMDMEMPVMDGYMATKEIRKWEATKKKRPTPIVALTAHALKEHEQKAMDAGCTGYFTKPFRKQAFLETIYKYGSKPS